MIRGISKEKIISKQLAIAAEKQIVPGGQCSLMKDFACP
jgi:hypothetical protein